MRHAGAIWSVALLALLLGACGGGGDMSGDARAGASDEPGEQALCDRLDALMTAADGPSPEQLESLVEAAPVEIRDDVRTLVDIQIHAGDGERTGEPEAADRFLTWTSQHCQLG